jgi:hypothetical protein
VGSELENYWFKGLFFSVAIFLLGGLPLIEQRAIGDRLLRPKEHSRPDVSTKWHKRWGTPPPVTTAAAIIVRPVHNRRPFKATEANKSGVVLLQIGSAR